MADRQELKHTIEPQIKAMSPEGRAREVLDHDSNLTPPRRRSFLRPTGSAWAGAVIRTACVAQRVLVRSDGATLVGASPRIPASISYNLVIRSRASAPIGTRRGLGRCPR